MYQSEPPNYRITDTACLTDLFRSMVCQTCFEKTLSISATDASRFACRLVVECENCPELDLSVHT